MPLCASPISQVNSWWDLDQGTCCKHNKCQMKRPGIPRSAWLDFTSQVWPMQFLSVLGLKVITLTRSLASRAFNFDNWRRENILLHFDSIFFSSSSRSWKTSNSSVGCPASVTSPLISTIWCFRAYKPYIFCEDMILATCQCQHIFCCWVEPSLLLSSSS